MREKITSIPGIIILVCTVISGITAALQIFGQVNVISTIVRLVLWLRNSIFKIIFFDIPILYIILAFIGWNILKRIFKSNKGYENLEREINNNSSDRYIIYLCREPIALNELRHKFFDQFKRFSVDAFNLKLKYLQKLGGIKFDEVKRKWYATQMGIKIIAKYRFIV